MSVNEEIQSVVDQLTEDAADVLDYLHWLTTDGETLSEEERARVQRGEQQIARGEYLTLAALRRLCGELG
ncbi:MAG TPA: hypothetical protein VK066_19945 [Chloroflexota bacterium]|nr:hypothetical protein [Chloroflexota bacterium]